MDLINSHTGFAFKLARNYTWHPPLFWEWLRRMEAFNSNIKLMTLVHHMFHEILRMTLVHPKIVFKNPRTLRSFATCKGVGGE